MHLGLDHPHLTADGLGRGNGLAAVAREPPLGHGNRVIGKKLLGLIFVKIHQYGDPGVGLEAAIL